MLPNRPFIKRRRIAGHDIILNVSFQESMIRFIIVIFLPIIVLFISKDLVIYTAPVMGYLFLSALVQFCVIKYIWQRNIKHQPAPDSPAYGDDPNYPEESV